MTMLLTVLLLMMQGVFKPGFDIFDSGSGNSFQLWFRTSPSSELLQFLSPNFHANVSSSPLTCRRRTAAGRQGRRLHLPNPTATKIRVSRSGNLQRRARCTSGACVRRRAIGRAALARSPAGNGACARGRGGSRLKRALTCHPLNPPPQRPGHQVPGLRHKLT